MEIYALKTPGLQLSTLWQHLCGWLLLLPKVWKATCEGTNQQEVCWASVLFKWWMSDECVMITIPHRCLSLMTKIDMPLLQSKSQVGLWYKIDTTYYHMVICHVPSGPRRRKCRNCSDCLPDVGPSGPSGPWHSPAIEGVELFAFQIRFATHMHLSAMLMLFCCFYLFLLILIKFLSRLFRDHPLDPPRHLSKSTGRLGQARH